MLQVLSVILGVLLIMAGASCFVLPEMTFLMLGYIIGIVMLVEGVERMIIWFQRDRGTDQSGWTLFSAIFSLVMGVILICNDILQLTMDVFIVYMCIGWLIFLGILRIVHAFQVRKMRKEAQAHDQHTELGRDWWVALILGILLVACGVIGFFVPAVVAGTIGILIGIGIIICGINLIHFATSSWMVS